MSLHGLMPNIARVERRQPGQSETGAVTATYRVVHQTVQCRITAASKTGGVAQGREAVSGVYRMLFPLGSDVRQNDRIVDITGGRPGASYTVQVVRDAYGALDVLFKIAELLRVE